MTLPARFEAAALEGLHAARDWYERQNPGIGDELAGEVWQVIDRAAASPALAPEIVVPGTSREVRRATLRRFPYAVVDGVLWVVAVAHGRRRPGYWHQRLN